MILLAIGMAVIALSLIGMIAFTALPAARRFKRECWSELPVDWKAALFVVIVLGVLGDFVFNQTRAVVIFGGFSKLLLSSRIQKRVDDGKMDALTKKWVRILNTGDPDHIKLVPW